MSRRVSFSQAKKDLQDAKIVGVYTEITGMEPAGKERVRELLVEKKGVKYSIITCGVYKLD
jgi:hypothetical protein